MFTKTFWKDTIERSISTAAQFALGAMGGQAVDKIAGGFDIVLYAALTGAVLTILKSLAAASFGNKDSASFVK